MPIAAQNLVRLAALTGNDAWRDAGRPAVRRLLPHRGENLFSHVALLNALDLRLRAAEIVVTGEGAPTGFAAALKIPFLDRIVLRAPSAEALPPRIRRRPRSPPRRRQRPSSASVRPARCRSRRAEEIARAVLAMRK